MWTYDQLSGALSKDGQHVATGYSGFAEGKNNPGKEQVHDVGPIPKGVYGIGPPHDSDTHGPHVMPLTPQPGTKTFGRDGFLIHGDAIHNLGNASHGCIILGRPVRDQISASGDRQIEVICAPAFTPPAT